METTQTTGTTIAKAFTFTFPKDQWTDGDRQNRCRNITLHREADGSLLTLSCSNPEPETHDDPDETVHALVIPPAGQSTCSRSSPPSRLDN